METVTNIAVGGGPSGHLIEGSICRAVHICCALGDNREKNLKAKKKKKKKEGKIEKEEKEMSKKRKIADILFIFYALQSFYGHSMLFK